MSTTTALDLLAAADAQTRLLRRTDTAATPAQWDSFDVTLHRLLLELTGPQGGYVNANDPSRPALSTAARSYPSPLRPPVDTQLRTNDVAAYLNTTPHSVVRRVRRGTLHSVKEGTHHLYDSASIDERPDIRPADPSDPHPLAKASCALGAMADLLREARLHGPAVLHHDGEVAGATTHVLSLAAVAARHTIAHGAFDDAIRPVLVGRYAERMVDSIRELARHPATLEGLTSVTAKPQPFTLSDRLETDLNTWKRCAREEIAQAVPSVDVLRQIANQGAHLASVRAGFAPPDDAIVHRLHNAAAALTRADQTWSRSTTLVRPSHQFVTASRELFQTLNHLKEPDGRAVLDIGRATTDLDRGLAVVSDMMTISRSLPDRLIAANVLWAPAQTIRPTEGRIQLRARGRLARVRQADLPGLAFAWRAADDSLARSVHLTLDRHFNLPNL